MGPQDYHQRLSLISLWPLVQAHPLSFIRLFAILSSRIQPVTIKA
jgi:hypothetical protein